MQPPPQAHQGGSDAARYAIWGIIVVGVIVLFVLIGVIIVLMLNQ